MKLLLRILVGIGAVLLTAQLLPQAITVSGYYPALIVSLVIGIMSITVKPVLNIIALPINLLTLGLFSFVIDGIILYFIGSFVQGFAVAGLWWAIVAAFVIGLIKWLGHKLLNL